jgi:hypothetical protein
MQFQNIFTRWRRAHVGLRHKQVEDGRVGDVGELEGDDGEEEEVPALIRTPPADMVFQKLLEIEVFRRRNVWK